MDEYVQGHKIDYGWEKVLLALEELLTDTPRVVVISIAGAAGYILATCEDRLVYVNMATSEVIFIQSRAHFDVVNKLLDKKKIDEPVYFRTLWSRIKR